MKGFFGLLLASFAIYIKFALGIVAWICFIPLVSSKFLRIHLATSFSEIPEILTSWNLSDILLGLSIVAAFLFGSVVVTSFAQFMEDLERQELNIDGQPEIPPIHDAEVEPQLEDVDQAPEEEVDDDFHELFGMNAGIRNMIATLFLILLMIDVDEYPSTKLIVLTSPPLAITSLAPTIFSMA